MNEKLSFQHVSDALAQKAGVSKKVADIFTKAFFDTVVDAFYMGEESVKVKGLGTFKLVEVESRESVNVSNGERIVIPGYKKVSFTPEDGVVEFLSQNTVASEEQASIEEMSSAAEGTSVVEEAPVVEETPSVEDEMETLIQVPEPVNVEEPQDAFSGIDMLISTPESMDEVRQQYEEAKAKMEAAVEEARKANAEKVRLEKLLARLEANAVPERVEDVKEEPEASEEQSGAAVDAQVEMSDEPSVEEETVADASMPSEQPQESAAEEDKHQEAFNRFINETPRLEEQPAESKRSHTLAWGLVAVFVMLVGIGYFLYQTFLSIEAVETVPEVEKREVKKMDVPHVTKPVKAEKLEEPKTVAPKAEAPQVDSPKKNEQKVAPKKDVQARKEETKPAKPMRPSTHVLQRGESLTRISQKYYGTKDSVRAILRVNKFNDPDNLPVGAVVKLP